MWCLTLGICDSESMPGPYTKTKSLYAGHPTRINVLANTYGN